VAFVENAAQGVWHNILDFGNITIKAPIIIKIKLLHIITFFVGYFPSYIRHLRISPAFKARRTNSPSAIKAAISNANIYTSLPQLSVMTPGVTKRLYLGSLLPGFITCYLPIPHQGICKILSMFLSSSSQSGGCETAARFSFN